MVTIRCLPSCELLSRQQIGGDCYLIQANPQLKGDEKDEGGRMKDERPREDLGNKPNAME
jgi:hypothetical protein